VRVSRTPGVGSAGALADAGRRIAVLDADPTGSQTVSGVDVATVFEPGRAGGRSLRGGSTCFVLTNTRSLPEAEAVELNTRIGRILFELADRLDAPINVVNHSDSTLRGCVIAEVLSSTTVARGRRRSGPTPPGSIRVWSC